MHAYSLQELVHGVVNTRYGTENQLGIADESIPMTQVHATVYAGENMSMHVHTCVLVYVCMNSRFVFRCAIVFVRLFICLHFVTL